MIKYILATNKNTGETHFFERGIQLAKHAFITDIQELYPGMHNTVYPVALPYYRITLTRQKRKWSYDYVFGKDILGLRDIPERIGADDAELLLDILTSKFDVELNKDNIENYLKTGEIFYQRKQH